MTDKTKADPKADPKATEKAAGVIKNGKANASDNWGEPGAYAHLNGTTSIKTN